jgi:hypothetical protein
MFGLLKHQAVTYFQSVVRATGATISIGQQGPGYRMYSFSRMLFHVRKALSYTSPGLMIYKDSYPSKKVNLGMLDPLPHSFRFVSFPAVDLGKCHDVSLPQRTITFRCEPTGSAGYGVDSF